MRLYQAYVAQLSTGKLKRARERNLSVMIFFPSLAKWTPTFFLLVPILATEDGYIFKVFVDILEEPGKESFLTERQIVLFLDS